MLTLSDGQEYFLRVETGAIKDLAGNDMPILFTRDTYRFSTGEDSTAPAVVATFPCDGCEDKLVFEDPVNAGEGLEDFVVVFFSEAVSAVADSTAQIDIMDCGSDFVCVDTDNMFNHIDVTSNHVSFSNGAAGDGSFNRMYISVGDLPSFRRYKFTIPAGAFTDGANTGPVAATSFEFVKLASTTVYNYADMAVKATSDSSDEGLVFALHLYSGAHPTEHTVCYCDDQKDMTLEDMGDGDSTYRIVDDLKCSDTISLLLSSASATVADRTISEHQCESKCVRGCTGPYCYCDGYDAAADASTLCLPPSLCRAACDALGSACGGINVHDSKPQCLLLPSSEEAPSPCINAAINGTDTLDELPPELTIAEDWQLFTKHAGTACTNLADYKERAGSLYITNRVEVSVDYVLHPGKDGSIELTTPVRAMGDMSDEASLTYEHSQVFGFTANKLLSKDRITIIDCKGTCGVSSPTAAVVTPLDGSKIETWNDFSPFSWFVDLPSIDDPNDVDPEKQINSHAAKPSKSYTPRQGSYCPQSNIDLDDHEFPFGGVRRPLKDHQCYTKCGLNAPCEDDDCFCDGYYSGYDSITSNALCADVKLCQYLCDNTEGCESIDMHRERNRCFLNYDRQCSTHEDRLKPDEHYTLLIQQSDFNDEQAGAARRLAQAKEEARRLLPAADLGFSWDKMLRFKPLQFKSGGTFKLCFCDSAILGPGRVCSTEKDYKIEVGTIHASGVSCLIANPKLQRVSCTGQRHGGLRCYEHIEAPKPEPPMLGVTILPPDEIVTPLSLSAKCLYMPEEEAAADPECQTVSGYQSTLGR